MSSSFPSTYEIGNFSTDYRPIPPLGDPSVTDAALEQVVDSRITYSNLLWMWMISRWRLAELMDEAVHWVKPAWQSTTGVAPWQWVPDNVTDQDATDELPRPTLNEGYPIRANESSRLARPRYRPEARPGVDNPDALTRQACKKLTRAMNAELDRMRYATEDDIGHYRSPLHGQQIHKGWWEQRWDDAVIVPSPTAKQCPNDDCDFTSTSGMVAADKAAPLLEKAGAPIPEDAAEVAVENCLQCGDHPALVPFKPSMDELASGKNDSFGRPLGTSEPRGNYRIDCCSPYDVFLPNCGVNLRWDDIPEWVHCHVESLDWVALHFPEKAALVRPENPSKLMEYHPIAGSPTFYGQGTQASLFKNHVRVKELYKKPWMELDPKTQKYKLNRGRYIAMAGGVRLVETDFMMKSLTRPGEFVERACLEMPPWDMREGGHMVHGMSLWDQMVSPQEQIDEIASQRAAVRERCAVPLFWTPKDSNFRFVDRSVGVPGALVESEIVPGQGAAAMIPKIISNSTIASGVNEEDERYATFMNNVGGRSDVEKGDVPGNVSAATAINILREESGQVRSQRIERIKASRKRLFSHMARTMTAMWLEARPFKYDENGKERWDKATGLDFQGFSNVELEAEPEFDSADQEREAVRDVIGLGIDLSTPQGRKMARAVGAPPKMFVEDDIQELGCDREWRDFLNGRSPVMDPSLDDPGTHYQHHGERCSDEQFTLLEDQAGWDAALSILSDNWDQDLQMAVQPATGGVPMMTGQIDPMTGQPRMIAVPYMQAVQLGLVAPAAPMSMEQKIANAWRQKLQMFQFQPRDPKALERVIAWRSHIEAHRLYGQMKQQLAQQQAVMASPGAEETTAGTEVTPGTPAAQVATPAMN